MEKSQLLRKPRDKKASSDGITSVIARLTALFRCVYGSQGHAEKRRRETTAFFWFYRVVVTGLLIGTFSSTAFAQARNYMIYDGQRYAPNNIEAAVRSPVILEAPRLLQNGAYFVSRSADGHYYMPGAVNGHPVVFLVDTGATFSVIPAKLARNAGIRAGVVEAVHTASDRVQVGLSEGNRLMVGAFTVPNAKVGVQDNLPIPILGVDVLNRFQVTYANGAMIVRLGQ